MTRGGPSFFAEERQYVPFVAGAIFFALIVGFPLGFTLAHAAAQDSDLGGHWQAMAQAHGHLQLMGWGGLFVMGLGYRLVSRFTSVRVRPAFLVPLTFLLMATGLSLRAVAQPFADEGPFDWLFALSAALEAAGVFIFAGSILRCLATGRRDEFLYTPFFAAGAVWAAVAAGLSFVFVLDAAEDSVPVVSGLHSLSLTFVQLFGFVAMFIFAVSLRTFPIFFGREPANRALTLAGWALANAAIGVYAAATVWKSYEPGADVRVPQTLAFALAGAAFLLLLGVLRIFQGTPHRLRPSARRSVRFVRSAYAWLAVAAVLALFYAARALLDGRALRYYETDAVRHFVAVGFLTTMIIGMALLVLPRIAMRRPTERAATLVAPVLLGLLHAATAARGAGSILVDEAEVESGFWTMSAGGLAAILALALFAGYLLLPAKRLEIDVQAVAEESG